MKQIDIVKYNTIIFTFLLLISYYPYVFCQIFPLPNAVILSFGFIIIFSFLLCLKRQICKFPKIIDCIAFSHITFCLLSFVFHHDSSYITRIVLFSVSYLAIFALYNVHGILSFIRCYNKFILLMAIGGSVCFILVLFFSYSPLFVFENIDERNAYCFAFTCTNSYLGNIIRYSGFFDEPGAMAYWGMFALIFNKLFIHDAKYENCLIILLFFTFSLAYYIQLFFFILFFKIRKTIDFFVMLFVCLIVIGAILLSESSDINIYKLTLARIELDEETGFAGNNRADPAKEAKKNFVENPIMGIGAKKMESMDYMADNPYEILAKDGIIGWIITYLPLLIIVSYKYKDKRFLYSFLILMLGYLQRPFHINFVHYIMLYIFLVATYSIDNTSNKILKEH